MSSAPLAAAFFLAAFLDSLMAFFLSFSCFFFSLATRLLSCAARAFYTLLSSAL
jgi:hypothetical protein